VLAYFGFVVGIVFVLFTLSLPMTGEWKALGFGENSGRVGIAKMFWWLGQDGQEGSEKRINMHTEYDF